MALDELHLCGCAALTPASRRPSAASGAWRCSARPAAARWRRSRKRSGGFQRCGRSTSSRAQHWRLSRKRSMGCRRSGSATCGVLSTGGSPEEHRGVDRALGAQPRRLRGLERAADHFLPRSVLPAWKVAAEGYSPGIEGLVSLRRLDLGHCTALTWLWRQHPTLETVDILWAASLCGRTTHISPILLSRWGSTKP